jgi:hypothetical protein
MEKLLPILQQMMDNNSPHNLHSPGLIDMTVAQGQKKILQMNISNMAID